LAPDTLRFAELPKQTVVVVGVTVRGGVVKLAGKLIETVPLHPVTVFITLAVYTPPTLAVIGLTFGLPTIPGPVQV
jgi:hypothetical protein